MTTNDNDDNDEDTAVCGSCRLVFADAVAFDRHRLRGRCADPAERGLVPLWCGWKWLEYTGANPS